MIALYLDMDGVLVDFERGAQEQLGFDLASLGINASSSQLNSEGKAEKKRLYDLILANPDFWDHLHPMDDALELWSGVMQYDPIILTAAPKHHGGMTGPMFLNAAERKREWIRWHLGIEEDERFICTSSSKKQEFIGHKKGDKQILIDDRINNVENWVAAGAIGIFHTSATNSLKELRKIIT